MVNAGETGLAETVRRYYDLIDSNDLDGVAALFAADAVYERPGYPPFVGAASIGVFYRNDRRIAAGRHELTNVLANGCRVAVEGRFAGQLRDGQHAATRFADFWEFGDDGLVRRRDTYFFSASI
jgi:ketosteroid isomerase-like protein